VATSPKTPLLSILLRGEPGSGKTALSAFLAQRNAETFPYVKMIRPEDYVGYSETNKAIRITKVFEDAYRSPLSIIIIDNIERLLEYVPVVPVRFSSPVLQAIMVLVTRRPEKPGHRLLIIGTTSHPEFLDQVQLAERFDVTRQVPLLEEEAEIASVLAQQEVPIAPRDKEEISKNCVRPIGVRELLMLIEMARQSPDGVTWPSFKECMAHTALQRRADKRRQAQALAALSMGSERD
jgi:vesicle-fusing ATPase